MWKLWNNKSADKTAEKAADRSMKTSGQKADPNKTVQEKDRGGKDMGGAKT